MQFGGRYNRASGSAVPIEMCTLTQLARVAVIALAAAATAATAAEELEYEGRVVVGPDGNGWVSARFPTTVGGDQVRYFLDVWTECADECTADGDRPPIKALAVTLNDEVVFRKTAPMAVERVPVTLNLAGTSDNEIMASAEGPLGAAARFAVVAVH